MLRLQGKNALVTGATSGIGLAVAARFAAEGAGVAINHLHDIEAGKRAQAYVEQAAKAAGIADPKTHLVDADVSQEDQVVAMITDSVAALGSLDILINNAGIQKPTPTEELDMQDFDRVMNVNLRGAFLCAREVIRHFLARGAGGIVINNSSVHQIIPKPKYLPYSLSKGAIENLTRTLALEYASRGIRVNAVGPGAVVTPLNDAWIHNSEARAVVESHIPMGRPAEPEEIAAVFAFLASDDASYITGQTIFACGGLTLFPEFRTAWASGE